MKTLKPWPKPTPDNAEAYRRSREREKLIKPGIVARFLFTPATDSVKPGTVGVVTSVKGSFAEVRVGFLRFFHRNVFTHVSLLEPVQGGSP